MYETSDNSPSGPRVTEPTSGSGAMFDNLAKRYDLLNRIISLGVDKRWRKHTVQSLALRPESTVLDVATGTGDLAIDIAKQHPKANIVGLDPSGEMLALAQKKITALSLSERLQLREGVAENLPFPDHSFDALTIAFGIRNCVDRPQALREMKRVVRPGGHVAILELSEPQDGIMASLARFHIHHVIPRIGAWLSGAKEYRYLQESIAAFPPPKEFSDLMRTCGLEFRDLTPFSFGSCHLYLARVPESSIVAS